MGETLEFVPEVYQLSQHETDIVLVKNTEQTAHRIGAALRSSIPKRAQAFTTGANADGYTLSSVGIRFDTIEHIASTGSQLTVTMNAADNDEDPGAALCTLSDPSSYHIGAQNTFDAPSAGANQCPTLTANTTYFVVMDRAVHLTALKLKTTFSSSEFTGGAAGWSIENNRKYFQSGAWEETASVSYMIKVSGTVATAPPLTVSPLAVFDPNLYDVGSTSPYLVMNTERFEGLAGSSLDNTTTKLSQQFTTGPNADGNTLGSIAVRSWATDDFSAAFGELTVTLNGVANDGNPGGTLCTLVDPRTWTSILPFAVRRQRARRWMQTRPTSWSSSGWPSPQAVSGLSYDHGWRRELRSRRQSQGLVDRE